MYYSFNATKILRGMLLAILTFYMIHLVKSGDINLLVSPIIARIVNLSIIPFIAITITTLTHSFVRARTNDHGHDHNHAHHHHVHDHSESCELGHTHANPNSFWAQTTVGLLVVALSLAYSWHPKALGTDMIAQAKTQVSISQTSIVNNANNNLINTATNTTSSSSTSSANSSSHSAYAPGIIDVNQDTVGIVKQTSGDSEASIAMRFGADPKAYWGKKVALDGFVYHPNGLPANHFILTRFFIFCCVADANPIGITVNSSEAAQLKNDTWVHISGLIQPETLPILDQLQPTNWYPNDSKKPVIIANSIQVIPTPDKPYMIPN